MENDGRSIGRAPDEYPRKNTDDDNNSAPGKDEVQAGEPGNFKQDLLDTYSSIQKAYADLEKEVTDIISAAHILDEEIRGGVQTAPQDHEAQTANLGNLKEKLDEVLETCSSNHKASDQLMQELMKKKSSEPGQINDVLNSILEKNNAQIHQLLQLKQELSKVLQNHSPVDKASP